MDKTFITATKNQCTLSGFYVNDCINITQIDVGASIGGTFGLWVGLIQGCSLYIGNATQWLPSYSFYTI